MLIMALQDHNMEYFRDIYGISLLFMGAIDVYLYFRFKKAQWL
jgi:hypothetical protein